MEWIDAHCHLHSPWFLAIDDVLEASRKGGVRAIVNCSSEPKTFHEVEKFSENDGVYHTLGLQPTLAGNYKNQDFFDLFQPYIGECLKGIGEVGLDYYWVKDEKERKIQRDVFEKIIKTTNELNLPIVIHSRKAESDCLDLLEKFADTPVLLHSFDGNLKETTRAVDLGYMISVPTNVTIRKNRRKTVKRAGLDRILLETDSPFCVPSEDIKRNDPSNIPIAGKYIAKLLEIDVEEVSRVTTENASKFYDGI